jgi:hypothetical protein
MWVLASSILKRRKQKEVSKSQMGFQRQGYKGMLAWLMMASWFSITLREEGVKSRIE